jgi:hypothetical protein
VRKRERGREGGQGGRSRREVREGGRKCLRGRYRRKKENIFFNSENVLGNISFETKLNQEIY